MTAIEWLEEQLPIRIKNSMYSEIKEAKEKEKQQIIDAIHKRDDELDLWYNHQLKEYPKFKLD
jgi:hypothetical protein